MPMNAAALESHLSKNSYISGYAYSQADADEFAALAGKPSTPHSARWYRHIQFLTGNAVAAPAAKPAAKAAAKPAAKAADDVGKSFMPTYTYLYLPTYQPSNSAEKL